MACPYFFPIEKAAGLRQPARAPLGVIYHGRCDAGGTAETEACNFGYGRGSCDAFPADSSADAVRFTRLGDRTIYVLEREYLPIGHGDAAALEGTLARQAEVFCEWAAK
jgi:hypothetical protein